MAIHFTLKKFPISGTLRDECGLPWSCVVQPYAKLDVDPTVPKSKNLLLSSQVGRCEQCYSYINQYCGFQSSGWSCSLCGAYNEYRSLKNKRYARHSLRYNCPELQAGVTELVCELGEGLEEPVEGTEALTELPAQPVYIALVDTCCCEEFLELVKSSLLAVLEAVPGPALFGLVTFSTKVGMYDVVGAIPSVKYVPLMDFGGASPTLLELEEAMPLETLLAPVATCKEAISAALESLQPDSLARGGDNPSGRAFGGAVQAVLRYLGGAGASVDDRRQSGNAASTSGQDTRPSRAGARLLAFLAGAPNKGRGRVFRPKLVQTAEPEPALENLPPFPDVNPYTFMAPAPQAPPSKHSGFSLEDGGTPHQEMALDPGVKSFYQEAATAAAALGVCVDVYAVTPGPVGLFCIEALATGSGGAMYLYTSFEDAALPQDVYRRLSSPQAMGGMLRLRTSPEFQVVRSYGRLVADDRYENLYHVVATDPHSCAVFDFDFANADAFSGNVESPPVIQMVFQYSVLAPALAAAVQPSESQPAANGAGATQEAAETGGGPLRYTLQRRLRIFTVPMPVARTPLELYQASDPDTILCVLMHKIVKAAEEEGLPESCALLQDWLILFTAHYNRHMVKTSNPAGQVDVTFEEVEALQPVARLVYALLRSPLLSQAKGSALSDERSCCQHLWGSLPPPELRRAVYPVLSSYTDTETQAFPRHSLSRAALITSGAHIFLLDTFITLILYYHAGYPPDLPFPPPQQSALRTTINALRANRRVTPLLRMLRGGIDDVTPFTKHLIEEADAGANGGGSATPGFVAFLENLKNEVRTFLEDTR